MNIDTENSLTFRKKPKKLSNGEPTPAGLSVYRLHHKYKLLRGYEVIHDLDSNCFTAYANGTQHSADDLSSAKHWVAEQYGKRRTIH